MRESSREKLERRRRKGLKESLVFGGKSSLRYVNMIFEALVVFLLDFGYILGFCWDFILTLTCKRPVFVKMACVCVCPREVLSSFPLDPMTVFWP